MNKIVWYDTETTGLDSKVHRIIQLSAIVTGDGKNIEEFDRKIQFDESKANKKALEINHYDANVWAKEAIPEAQAMNEFMLLLKRHKSVRLISRAGNAYFVARLAGHNEKFDNAFLRAMHDRCGGGFLPVDYRALDTLQLALWRYHEDPHGPENYKLETLCKFLDIDVDSEALHSAIVDVRATIALGLKLMP